MAASHKCRCRIFGGAASSTSYQVAQRTSIGMSTILGNTLLSRRNSLILEIFSLLICLGNCSGKCCSAAVSCSGIGWRSPEIANFPVKFPVSREFAWRRVRSALRRQPSSPALRETAPNNRRNARQWRAFLIQWTVSSLPISRGAGRNCQRSPAACRNIPVFGRRWPETRFALPGGRGSAISGILRYGRWSGRTGDN